MNLNLNFFLQILVDVEIIVILWQMMQWDLQEIVDTCMTLLEIEIPCMTEVDTMEILAQEVINYFFLFLKMNEN